MPLGVWALVVIDPVYIRWARERLYRRRGGGGHRLAVSRARLRRHDPGGGRHRRLGGAIGMAGPVIVTFWLAGQGDAAAARRNIIVYFGVSGVVSLAIFLTGGLMTGQV